MTKKIINDSSLINIYKAIGRICFEKNILDQLLTYFYHLIDCRFKKKKSFEDSSVIEIYNLIGKVYLTKHHFNQISKLIQSQLENQPINKY